MKHTATESNRAKKKLINYCKFKEIDFYKEDNIWYLNCKDNVGESAFDTWNEKVLSLKESLEYENQGYTNTEFL